MRRPILPALFAVCVLALGACSVGGAGSTDGTPTTSATPGAQATSSAPGGSSTQQPTDDHSGPPVQRR